MATVAQIAKASLQQILVQESEADLEPDEYQDFIFALNNWMAAREADGIDLGWQTVSSLGDTVTVADGAIDPIVHNMAVVIAPMFGRPVPPELALMAGKGMNTLRHIGQAIIPSVMPDTLPVGSGNEDTRTGRFYDEEVEGYDNVVSGDAQVVT